MRQTILGDFILRLNNWRKQRHVQTLAAVSLVGLGPILVGATYAGLSIFELGAGSPWLRVILLIDLIYVLLVATLIMFRIAQIFNDRRAKSVGSRLHSRLSATFAFVALVPTVIVAVFATITLNLGLEGWFSERVRDVVGNSLSAAQAYESEQQSDLLADINIISVAITNERRRQGRIILDGELVEILGQLQSQIQRGLKEAYVIDGEGKIRARGARSYLFDYEKPDQETLLASQSEPVLIQDWENNEFRALFLIEGFLDRYIYISRSVDGNLLNLLDDTKETISVYNQLEQERGRVIFELALLYLGFALIIILSATWLGLLFAERLARPVGRLAGAAQRVGAGDLSVQVEEDNSDDELAMLGRVFNRMTQQVKRQRDDLVAVNIETENRRRLFDSILTGVTAGVIGVSKEGEVEVLNDAAAELLGLHPEKSIGKQLPQSVPEFSDLYDELLVSDKKAVQNEISLTRAGKGEILLVRMAKRESDVGSTEGYVVTFDDVTGLVSAQRMAAWGDVARRIAHEIKNPLTPIQLSAERLKRKFGPVLGDQKADLDQYSDVIIRQTNDLRRIVDEFSKFARMPEPDRVMCNLSEILTEIVELQVAGQPDVEITIKGAKNPVMAVLDPTMINQALTNLIKNAGEAIQAKRADDPDINGQIRVKLSSSHGQASIVIQDNGIGLPKEKRSRLLEPYVTHREGGTGLGLPIVKKIAEEHGGALELSDAPKFKGNKHTGAQATLLLPLASDENNEQEKAA